MPEFLELLPPSQALQALLFQIPPQSSFEVIPLSRALGRVTAKDLAAPHPLPTFHRSSVDGYAVLASDTYGASESLPAYLSLRGEALMGQNPGFVLQAGECALIHTGGMLPEGANSVVMLEHTQIAREGEIEILRAVAPGNNLILMGEDVKAGEVVLPAGSFLRPADLGGLAALGIDQVPVTPQPRIAILSTGDEVIPVNAELGPGQVHDVNTTTLSALVISAGGIPVSYGILPDQATALAEAAQRAIRECDIVVFTAGSSASTRDLTADIVNGLGKPGVLVHGVNVRPGKPTILGVCAHAGLPPKAVIGLPGNPVSALVIAWLFILPLIRHWMGIQSPLFRPQVSARLAVNLASQAGREEWTPVKLMNTPEGLVAEPIFTKSNLIFGLSRAQGLVLTPPDATGLHAGEIVQVYLI
jgi:molybdopterin molybdotransferase